MAYPTPREMIDRLFTYHPPVGDQIERYREIRAEAREFALFLDKRVPDGPDKTLLIRRVHEVVMLANAAIACGEAQT